MPIRKLVVIALCSVLVGALAPAARAGVFTGTCILNVAFTFDTPIRSVTSGTASGPEAAMAVGYEVSASNGADVNPVKAGQQGCVIDVDPLDPFRGTAASGGGTAVSWTCEDVVAGGSWNQEFFPDPDPMFGSHTIVGTWGNWVMEVHNPSLTFTATINLTVAPSDVRKLQECETNGITELQMVGVMHLQDPEV
jgi:hypothetical protein